MRFRVTESPDFIKTQATGEGKPTGMLILRVLREHPEELALGTLGIVRPLYM